MIQRFQLDPDYTISRVIKGGWQLAEGHSERGTQDPLGDMRAFAELGIDTFDCADIYTGVEAMIGEFLAENRASGRRLPVKVHSKYVPDYDQLGSLRRGDVARIVDRSLRRLGQDRLDMVQFHWWNTEIPGYLEAAGWLQDLKQAGKIDRLSLTNFNRQITAEIIESGVSLATTQVQYSLLDTRPEKGLVELCEAHELHLLCYGTLAGGFLSDRWLGLTETQAEPSLLENRSLVKYRVMIEEAGGWDLFQSLLQTLRDIADHHEVSIASVACRWVLEQPRVAAVIIGARNRTHLHRYAELFRFSLQKQDLEQLNRAKQQMNVPPGDVFDLERDKSGPHGRIMKYNLNKN